MKILDTSRFFRTVTLFYQRLPFMGKISPALFLENITKTQPLPSIYKGVCSSYGSRVRMPKKNNAISKKLCHFKGLKLPHKMLTKSMQMQNSIANFWFNCNFTINSFAFNSYMNMNMNRIIKWNLADKKFKLITEKSKGK